MAAFVTGDLHGVIEVGRLLPSHFPMGSTLTKDDFLIVAGDFGLVWNFSADEMQWLDWLDARPWTTLFVDGNHENHEALASLPEAEWHGGCVHVARPSVLHLMRGQLFDICGSTVFTMGGATSVDRAARVEGRSWWPSELPSRDELDAASAVLDSCAWDVDYVVTHCCATSMMGVAEPPDGRKGPDRLTDWFDALEHRLAFRCWYFGHHHRDLTIEPDHRLLYHDVVELGGMSAVCHTTL